MNILLVDDHSVVRQGYATLLSALLQDCMVQEAGSANEALQKIAASRPDLVILDINMPGLSGIETAKRIFSRYTRIKILFFSMFDEIPMVSQALETGASGYISKRCSAEVMLEAVKAVLAGGTYLEHNIANRLATFRIESNHNNKISELTNREFETFLSLAKGLTTEEIADTLCVSAKTVANYITSIKAKLEVKSVTQLVHLALSQGLIRM